MNSKTISLEEAIETYYNIMRGITIMRSRRLDELRNKVICDRMSVVDIDMDQVTGLFSLCEDTFLIHLLHKRELDQRLYNYTVGDELSFEGEFYEIYHHGRVLHTVKIRNYHIIENE